MSDDVRIVVRVDDRTAAGFRDVDGRLRTLDGRFATSAGSMSRSSSKANSAITGLKATLLSLAPAAVPVAAAMAPIAVQAGAAGLAVAAFGAAVIPQIGNLKDATQAQTKYSTAVQQYGAHSKQAAQAQQQAAQVLGAMPKATARAAGGFMVLKDQFKSFSDSTAKFTMAPIEKSFVVMGQVIPKLRPMVEGTATQLDRLMTVAGGGLNTGAFDTLSKKVSDLANNTLKGATDKAIHFVRVLSEGNASGPIASFFEYARAQGPAVKQLLTNVSEAVANLLEGASQAGPGLLTLVNAFAKLVAAVPPSLIGNLMQVYAAFKLIKLAGAGVGAIAGQYATLTTRIAAMRAASVAAGGGIAGMNAALNTLSTGGKAALALGVVGGLALAMHKLSDNKAPVAVDELSTALNTLASKGKVTGALKENFDEISQSIAMVSKGASDNSVATMVSDFGTWVGISTGPGISDAKKNIDAWDKSMANLVRGGKPKEAAAQFEILKKAWLAGGGDVGRLKKFTNDYNNALADQKFEQQMAAESMGLFGQAAQDAQAKLDAQKSSADGLRQSIQALNDVNRQGLGGMIGFEAAMDAAASGATKYHDVLSMNNGQLSLNSDKQREAAQLLSDLADKTDSAAASARESGSSWETVNGVYSRGRDKLIESARAMGLNRTEAAALADQILKIPDKTATVKMNSEDAKAGLDAFNGAVRKTPGSKSITLTALSSGAEKVLEALGYHVRRLPNGKVVITAGGNALRTIGSVNAAMNAVNGKKSTTYIDTYRRTYFQTVGRPGQSVAAAHRPDLAAGGLTRGYAGGGQLQHFDDGGYISGPGTATSDSILATFGSGAMARVSDSEYVVKAAAVRKYGVHMLDAINDGRLQVAGFAKGGKLTKAQQRAKAQAEAESQARHDARGQLTISHFGQKAGYQNSEFGNALGRPDSTGSLVNALNQWRSIILKSTHGGTESRLLKQLDSTGKALLKQEKQLNAVNASLGKAKDKLADLKSAASSLASSVKGGILGSANITRGAGSDKTVTVGSIMGGLTASRDKATAFASALKDLQKKGVDKALIQQIAEAGIEGGGLETAGALLGASSSEIKSMNQLQGQIGKAAGSAGKTTADSVYGDAIKAQTATVKALQKSQDKLEKSMAHLAKVMEKSIEKAFGKKASGGIVGMAASGGIRSGLTWVGEQGPELADLPVGSRVWSNPDSRRKAQAPWASMLNTPRRPAAAAASAGGGPQEVSVSLEIRSGGSSYDEFLLKELRRAIRVRGGNVNFVLTGRTS